MSSEQDPESSHTSFRKYSKGPHGLGDPDDLSLRKVELNVLIPEIMRTKARKELCEKENIAFAKCAKEHGFFMIFKCQEINDTLKSCVQSYFEDPKFAEECKKIYLRERAEYRRTGIKKKDRAKFIASDEV